MAFLNAFAPMPQPTRPFKGTSGRAVAVKTNSFRVLEFPSKPFHQYDVLIFSESKGDNENIRTPARREQVIDRMQNITAPHLFQPRAVFDGKSILFVPEKKLALSVGAASGDILVNLSHRLNPQTPNRGVFRVRLTHVSTVQPKDLHELIKGNKTPAQAATAVNLLQLIIRQAAHQTNYHTKNSYFSDADVEALGGGLQIHRGFFQSVRPTLGYMTVNIDTSVAAMYCPGPVPEMALKHLQLACLTNKPYRNARDLMFREGDPELRSLSKHLGGLHITTIKPEKNYRIKKFIPYGGRYPFSKDYPDGDVRDTTVAEHYRETHNVILQLPDIMGVLVHGGGKPIIIPAELCIIKPGQPYKTKIPQNLMDKVGNFAKRRPEERLAMIEGGIRRGNNQLIAPTLAYEQSDYMRGSGMKVSSSPLVIQGRALQTPMLKYGGNNPLQPRDGAWNVVRQQFVRPMEIPGWVVLNFEAHSNDQMIQHGIKELDGCCRKLGMGVSSAPFFSQGNNAVAKSIESAMQRVGSGRPPILICILPKNAADLKTQIKRFCEVEHKIITQCLRIDKVRGAKEQYWNNVALKLNARLGGENSRAISPSLERLYGNSGDFMAVGADVGHPGPGVDRPSVASLVWSRDPCANQYIAFSSVQSPRQEDIADLQGMMELAIQQFGNANRKAVRRILFYRDGLSDGEFASVGQEEIKRIHAAIDRVWAKMKLPDETKPKVTFIVVGKRHHIRFFPDRVNADRSGNCPAGFVADEGLSHPSPELKDFYLQSHAGLLGTSRPAHYIILKDDIFGFDANLLQEVSFGLCHVYAKATRSVSIPAPVYYADLVCSRADHYFDPELRFADETASSISGSGERKFDLEKWKQVYKGRMVQLSTPTGPPSMYFL